VWLNGINIESEGFGDEMIELIAIMGAWPFFNFHVWYGTVYRCVRRRQGGLASIGCFVTFVRVIVISCKCG
jgi:hypothetical protein